MQWTITIESTGEFGSAHRSEMVLEENMINLVDGEFGLPVADGKVIMSHRQQTVVRQQCETYIEERRFCTELPQGFLICCNTRLPEIESKHQHQITAVCLVLLSP